MSADASPRGSPQRLPHFTLQSRGSLTKPRSIGVQPRPLRNAGSHLRSQPLSQAPLKETTFSFAVRVGLLCYFRCAITSFTFNYPIIFIFPLPLGLLFMAFLGFLAFTPGAGTANHLLMLMLMEVLSVLMLMWCPFLLPLFRAMQIKSYLNTRAALNVRFAARDTGRLIAGSEAAANRV